EDDVIRREPLLFAVNGQLYPSLSLAALRLALDAPIYNVRASGNARDARFGLGGIEAVEVGPLRLPTDAEGQLRVNYSTFRPDRYLPVWRALEGDLDGFEGVIVFIG